jgi:hypothetical protein
MSNEFVDPPHPDKKSRILTQCDISSRGSFNCTIKQVYRVFEIPINILGPVPPNGTEVLIHAVDELSREGFDVHELKILDFDPGADIYDIWQTLESRKREVADQLLSYADDDSLARIRYSDAD